MIKIFTKHQYLIILILIGFLFRVWNLTHLPAGFTADEASHGYDAYSLIQTGKDQWGQSWPIAFRSFGDFKLPVYTYLTIPFVIFNGLNEFSVRLPAAILGTLAILTTYLFTFELFRNPHPSAAKHLSPQLKANYLALFAALMVTISPWHLQLSRSAVEANLTSFFMPLALWTWLKGRSYIRNSKLETRNLNHWWILTAILLGINLYTYHAARAFTLLIIPLLILVYWQKNSHHNGLPFLNLFQNPLKILKPASSVRLAAKRTIRQVQDDRYNNFQLIKQNIIPILVFIIFLIPMGISLIFGGSSRGLDVAIFNPTDNWQTLSNLRHESVLSGLPDSIARLTTNKLTYSVKQFTQNYFTYLSPHFLFIQGPGEATYSMLPGKGVLHWFELPLLLIAIFYAIKKPNQPITFLLIILIFAPIPASLSKGAGLAANRATPMLPFIHILSAYGLTIVLTILNRFNQIYKTVTYLFLCFSVLLFFSFFLKDYLIHAPGIQAQSMSYGWREAVPQINQLSNQYDHIIVSRKFNEPHIFLMFYTLMDPNYIQQITPNWLEYQKQNLNFIDQLGEYHLDKFTFLEIQTEHLHQPNTLIIARPEDFLTPKPSFKEILRPSYPQPTPAIIFLNTSDQQ